MRMSELEKQRERMMEKQADDLPFGRPGLSGRAWLIIGIGIVLGLAIPLFYLALAALGMVAATSPRATAVLLALVVVLAAGGIFLRSRLRRRR
jgi:hypothetical protein